MQSANEQIYCKCKSNLIKDIGQDTVSLLRHLEILVSVVEPILV